MLKGKKKASTDATSKETGKTSKPVGRQEKTIFSDKMLRPKPWPKPQSQRPQAHLGDISEPKPKPKPEPKPEPKSEKD